MEQHVQSAEQQTPTTQNDLFDEFDDNPSPIITQLLSGNSSSTKAYSTSPLAKSAMLKTISGALSFDTKYFLSSTAAATHGTELFDDYVDVDEIDESMEELHELSEKLISVRLPSSSSTDSQQETSSHVGSEEAAEQQQQELQEEETVGEQLKTIYDTLYHAIYDCSNLSEDQDPVPYALIVELQREMKQHDSSRIVGQYPNKSPVVAALVSDAMGEPASPIERKFKSKLMQIDHVALREELNKVRKRSVSAPRNRAGSLVNSGANSPLSTPPHSPTSGGRRVLVDAQVIQNVTRKSFGEMTIMTADEYLDQKIEKLARLVAEEREMSSEDHENMLSELKQVMNKYNK